jgi:hypothetical protein
MHKFIIAIFILSGLVPLLSLAQHQPDSLLIYSVFVLACLFRRSLAALGDRLPGPAALHLVFFFVLAGELAEAFAWMGNYTKAAPTPGLLHPQLIANAILAVGLYVGWALAWLIVLRWYRFSLTEAYLITGFQAIFLEGFGAVLIRMMAVFRSNPLLALLMGLWVFAVHASVVGLALIPVIHRLDNPAKSRHWSRFPMVVVLVITLVILGCDLMGRVTLLFGGLPPKRSIIEHPFW